jgi:hypothetical protein
VVLHLLSCPSILLQNRKRKDNKAGNWPRQINFVSSYGALRSHHLVPCIVTPDYGGIHMHDVETRPTRVALSWPSHEVKSMMNIDTFQHVNPTIRVVRVTDRVECLARSPCQFHRVKTRQDRRVGYFILK